MKGRERRRGGRTGSATAWRSAGRRATEIGEKRRKSNETGRNRRKLNGSAAVGRGGARGLRRRDRPAPPSRLRGARSAQGRRSAGRSQRPKSGKAEARPKNRFGDRVATGGASGRWNRRKKTENEGNRPKSGETEGIGRCRVRRSARPSSPGPTCSPELVEGRPVGAGTLFRRGGRKPARPRRGGRTGSATGVGSEPRARSVAGSTRRKPTKSRKNERNRRSRRRRRSGGVRRRGIPAPTEGRGCGVPWFPAVRRGG